MRMKKARAAAAALLCAACLAQTAVPALAAEAYTAPDVTGRTLEQLMDDFRAEHALTGDNFEISFYVPETGEQYDFNETKMLYGASTYKLPLNLYYIIHMNPLSSFFRASRLAARQWRQFIHRRITADIGDVIRHF